MRRLDIGIASYGKPELLARTVAAVQKCSVTDWRMFIVDNPHPTRDMRELISGLADRDKRIVPVFLPANIGYAGAVNTLFSRAETEYIAYLDDDAIINTMAWDEKLCGYLDRYHEIGVMFPNGGAYQIDRGAYTEIMWAAGFAWVMNRMCASDLQSDCMHGRVGAYPVESGVFDETLGHQEEADAAQRVRMAGWKCAATLEVSVSHMATATNDPASVERINRGVVNWVNKWNKYFNGKNFNYHSPNVTRHEDWPPQALYLEEYWKTKRAVCGLPDGTMELSLLNAAPQVVAIDGREYDLIRVPRFKGFYVNRII
jgi:GT2 family glycosyltransferase